MHVFAAAWRGGAHPQSRLAGLLSEAAETDGVEQRFVDVRRVQSATALSQGEPAVLERLIERLEIRPGAGRQVRDANWVAAVREQGIQWLVTFGAAEFARFADVIDIEVAV